jgi:short-subunit dehydrogenase
MSGFNGMRLRSPRALLRSCVVSLLARHGVQVSLVGRTAPKLERVQQEIEAGGGKARVSVADVTRPQDTQRMALAPAAQNPQESEGEA